MAPHVLGYIRKGVIGSHAVIPDIVLQQTEEDRGNLGTADICPGPYRAVRIPDDIGKVIVAIKHARYRGYLPPCVNCLGGVHRDAGNSFGQCFIGIPAGKLKLLAHGNLVELNCRAEGIVLVLIGCAAVGFIG